MLRLITSVIIAILATTALASNDHPKPDFGLLGERICGMYVVGNVSGRAESVIKTFIAEEMGLENPSKEQIVKILNENSSEITCDNGKHFIHYSFERGKYNEIVGKLLITKFRVSDDVHYDFNNVTMTYNPETKIEEPMTVLDYIDKVALKTPEIFGDKESSGYKHIKRIRKMITKRFGAVSFEHLDAATKKKYR